MLCNIDSSTINDFAFLNIIKYRSERRDIGLCRSFIKCNITWNEYLATSLAPCNDFKKSFRLFMCLILNKTDSILWIFFIYITCILFIFATLLKNLIFVQQSDRFSPNIWCVPAMQTSNNK